MLLIKTLAEKLITGYLVFIQNGEIFFKELLTESEFRQDRFYFIFLKNAEIVLYKPFVKILMRLDICAKTAFLLIRKPHSVKVSLKLLQKRHGSFALMFWNNI